MPVYLKQDTVLTGLASASPRDQKRDWLPSTSLVLDGRTLIETSSEFPTRFKTSQVEKANM
jgi:hypothetical protein